MQGQNDPISENIIKSIFAIIFLSTPHRGTNLAETLNRILQVSFATNPMQFIAELASGSQTLLKLNEQFRHSAQRVQIVSFYEIRPTQMFRKTQIVSRRSSLSTVILITGLDDAREALLRSWISWRDINPYGL